MVAFYCRVKFAFQKKKILKNLIECLACLGEIHIGAMSVYAGMILTSRVLLLNERCHEDLADGQTLLKLLISNFNRAKMLV